MTGLTSDIRVAGGSTLVGLVTMLPVTRLSRTQLLPVATGRRHHHNELHDRQRSTLLCPTGCRCVFI
jgi:hypothetical protein